MDPRYVGLSNSSKVGITPLEIMYEDLDESRAATVRTVFDHLGVRGDVPRRRSQVKRQADELTERSVARYRHHRMHRDVVVARGRCPRRIA